MTSEFYRNKRALITGGLGFLGSNLALRLVELGADVTLVDSMLPAYGATVSNIEPIRDRVHVNFSDVRDPHSMRHLIRERDLIFSLAGQVSHSESMRDPMTDLEINCRSQLTLLECCRHGNPGAKIVFASTRQLYGRPQYLPVELAAEKYYSLYHDVHGLATVSLRLTNTYGPRMELANDSKGVVGVFIRKALLGETIRIYGTGQQRRDFNYVSDVVDALLVAGQSESVNGQVFNLGHPDATSLIGFVEILQELADFDFEFVPFPPEAEAIDIGDYFGDFGRYREATGWEPHMGLRDGLAKTLEYYRACGWTPTG
jgi:nucleoside-diphosphate-sugar epimerase